MTHRTLAEPRFLDASIDPNDRQIGHCYLGVLETVNSGPIGLARFSTLRAWMSQWSLENSNAAGEACAARIHAPLLAIEHAADDAAPQPDIGLMVAAYASADKTKHRIAGANHYFNGQPERLAESVALISEWVESHR